LSRQSGDGGESKKTERHLMADGNVDNVADALIKVAQANEAGLKAVASSLDSIAQQIGALSEVLKPKDEPGTKPKSD
jgi:uncharacterized protein YqfA (UPF0365 family)